MKRGPLIAAVVSAGVIILMIGVLILPKASQVRSKQRGRPATVSHWVNRVCQRAIRVMNCAVTHRRC